MSTVNPKPIRWLWKPYIPRGAATMIVGAGGFGKSWMTAAIAADLSAGRPLPGQDPLPPQKILMISAEDDLDYIMQPRLSSLGANLDNICVLNGAFTINDTKTERLIQSIHDFDAAIVFLDPLVVYMGENLDMYKANEVRSILNRLTQAARETDTAVVIVHHVRKAHADLSQNKAMGSADMANGVRSMLLTEVSEAGQYYMAHVKHNWSTEGKALAYHFNNDVFEWQGEYDSWGIAMANKPRSQAKAFLMTLLKDGAMGAVEIMARAKDEGFTEKTIQRAKHGICHSVVKERKWYWELDEGMLPHPPAAEPKATLKAYAKKSPEVTFPSPQEPTKEIDPTVAAILENWNDDKSS